MIMLCVTLYVLTGSFSKMGIIPYTGENRMILEYTEDYDIRYRLQAKQKYTGWWEDTLSFTQKDIANRYGDITEELIDEYIVDELGYLPDYVWEENPNDLTDRVRKTLKKLFQQFFESLE